MSDKPSQSAQPHASAPVSGSSDPVSQLLQQMALDPPSHPGQRAQLDRFEILRVLGEGGMGVVLLARDPRTNGRVAIKMLHPRWAGDPSLMRRSREEAEHQQHLPHPNILNVLERSSRPNGPYFVVPYMERGNLAKLIADAGRLDRDTALRIAKQIASALVSAHKLGIIHRDMKPTNVLIGNDDTAYLTDFGLMRSTLVNDSTIDVRCQPRVGTSAYMPPEVAGGEAGDFRNDIYGFGTILYEMLTGLPPYRGTSDEEILQQVRAGPPQSILESNPKADPHLAEIAQGAMARDLQDRYAQMVDALADLERVANGQTPLGPHSRLTKRKRQPDTRRMVMVGVACLGLVLAGSAVWSLRADRSSAPHHLVVSSSAVAVYARDGRVVWTAPVNGEVARAELAALEPGKPSYLVVGVRGGQDTGKLFVYDDRGALAWERQTAEPYPYRGGAVNQMKVVDLFVADLWQTGHPDIVVVSNDLGWFPSKITVFSGAGEARRIYWHPGQIQRAFPFKPSTGDRLWILAWGCNNDMRAVRPDANPELYYHALACLDPETMTGEAPPKRGTIGHGVERWYALLLPQHARITDVTLRPPWPGAPEGAAGQRIQVATNEGVFLVLDEDGNLVGKAMGDVSTSVEVRTELIGRFPFSPVPMDMTSRTQNAVTRPD